MNPNRANNQLIYDNAYLIQKLKQEKNQYDHVMYFGYNENENKCDKNSTCKVYPFDLVDTESDLLNLNRRATLYNETQFKPSPLPPTMIEKQQPYCNPYLYPPVKNNIPIDKDAF